MRTYPVVMDLLGYFDVALFDVVLGLSSYWSTTAVFVALLKLRGTSLQPIRLTIHNFLRCLLIRAPLNLDGGCRKPLILEKHGHWFVQRALSRAISHLFLLLRTQFGVTLANAIIFKLAGFEIITVTGCLRALRLVASILLVCPSKVLRNIARVHYRHHIRSLPLWYWNNTTVLIMLLRISRDALPHGLRVCRLIYWMFLFFY